MAHEVNGILSIWRSALDVVALEGAATLAASVPRCSIGPGEDFSAMTVYNFGFYTSTQSVESALTAMLSAMDPNKIGTTGGSAFIPQHPYTLTDVSYFPFRVPDQCNILGSGGGGAGGSAEFYHFRIQATGGIPFLICQGTTYTSGGVYFHGLAFRWVSMDANDTCITALMANCSAVRCTFTDCPTAFSAQAPGCVLKQCTIDYLTGSPDGATAVMLAGSQCAVLGPCEFEQTPVPPNPNGNGNGPKRCTCISVQGGADHVVIADAHISDWTTGIDFSQSGGSTSTIIRNCEIQTYLSALIVAGSDGAPISGVKVVSSTLSRQVYSAYLADSSAVVSLSSGSSNALLNDITLIDCTVYNMGDASTLPAQHGLEIAGGSNIKIIGGTYSNNSPNAGAGVAIIGACGDVQIIGANLQPSYDDGVSHHAVQSQLYGLLITSNPATGCSIRVSGCDMQNYNPQENPGAAPVSTSNVTQGLYVDNCLGYNDQNTPLNGPTAPTTSTCAATCSTPYFGPSVIAFASANPATIYVFGQTLSLSFGVIFLPSPYDSFYFCSQSSADDLYVVREIAHA